LQHQRHILAILLDLFDWRLRERNRPTQRLSQDLRRLRHRLYITGKIDLAAVQGGGIGERARAEPMLHKGPLPVNTIGPIVDLTPGSISTAVDRLVEKGLVSRVESAEDQRVRIVALTPCGKDLIAGAFRKHSLQMKRVFSELSPEELRGLETALKKVGKRAAALMEES
jgi:MarR family 2-MHQ and catechol resistance regulon transcriptional repressor